MTTVNAQKVCVIYRNKTEPTQSYIYSVISLQDHLLRLLKHISTYLAIWTALLKNSEKKKKCHCEKSMKKQDSLRPSSERSCFDRSGQLG